MQITRTTQNGERKVVDVVQNSGDLDYVKDGQIFKHAPGKCVMVESSSDLEKLTSYDPGTVAFTAGFGYI